MKHRILVRCAAAVATAVCGASIATAESLRPDMKGLPEGQGWKGSLEATKLALTIEARK